MAGVEDGKDRNERRQENDDEDEDVGKRKKRVGEMKQPEKEKESQPINKLRRESRLFNLPLEASAAFFAAFNEKGARRVGIGKKRGEVESPVSPSLMHSTPRLIMATCGKFARA